jgi:catechol 2,3-dioxygenase-like lactoylglutathione lyase family enzyme
MARKTPKPTRRTAAKTPRKQPETLRLASISPSLTVRDIERSLAWYRDILGFHVGERWEEGGKLQSVELHAGTVWLIINQDDFAKGRDRTLGEGVRFYANTRQDVDLLASDIKARGGVLAMEPRDRPWGTREFLVVDPDGYKIAITTMT